MAEDEMIAALEAAGAITKNDQTGVITFRWRGQERFTLQPPLLGELRQLETLLQRSQEAGEARRAAAAEIAAAKQAALAEGRDYDGPEPAEWTKEDNRREALEYWRLAFDLLADRPLPPDDQIEPWLPDLGTTLVVYCTMHWSTYPMQALGNSLAQLLGATSNGAAG